VLFIVVHFSSSSFLEVLGSELMASCLLGRRSTLESHHQPTFFFSFILNAPLSQPLILLPSALGYSALVSEGEQRRSFAWSPGSSCGGGYVAIRFQGVRIFSNPFIYIQSGLLSSAAQGARAYLGDFVS
jgi:hypothetical protein